jgi:hypothetical protein
MPVDYGAIVKSILDAQPRTQQTTPAQQQPLPINTLPQAGAGAGAGTGAGTGTGTAGAGTNNVDYYSSPAFLDALNQQALSQSLAGAKDRTQMYTDMGVAPAPMPLANGQVYDPATGGATDLQSLLQSMQQVTQQPLTQEQAWAALTNYAPLNNPGSGSGSG